jgi:hypothetical protein
MQVFSDRQRLIAGVVLALAVFSFAAKAQTPKFKVGDRVEVDTNMSTTPAYASWKKGTVTQVMTDTDKVYIVEIDPVPGKLPQTSRIPIRPYAEGWIKPLAGAGPAPVVAADMLRLDGNGTVLADRDLLDCKRLKQPTARNGSPLPVELAKTLIRCLYEKPSSTASDGATTMDIVEFKPGPSRRWIEKEDRGSAATPETLVFPIRVKWDQKTFYRSYNQIQTGNERIFTCFVDGDVWYCGPAQFIKDGEKQQTKVKSN